MATRGFYGSSGTSSGVSGSGSIGNTPYQVIDPTAGKSFANQLPNLLNYIQNLRPPNYQDLVSQGVNSPLMQSILGPALANLAPGEDLARQNFTDEFRRAGALGSGAMGAGSANLERGILGQRGNLISQVLSQMLPQITQGLGQQFNQQANIGSMLANVLGMSKPSIVTGTNAAAGGAGGAGGGGGIGGFPSAEKSTADAQAQWNSNPYLGGNFGGGNNLGNFDLTGLFNPNNLTSSPTNYQGTYIGPEGYITPGSSSVYGPAPSYDPYSNLMTQDYV